MNPIPLTARDLAVSAALLALDGLLSIGLSLGLHRAMLIAAVRMVVQLLLVGLVLRFVFAAHAPLLTLGLLLLMVAVAAREASARPAQRLGRLVMFAIAGAAIGSATGVTAILALTTALRPRPWYDARYAIPLTGIVLGNVLNGCSLTLDSLLGGIRRERAAIEARLALGHSFALATGRLRREAMRRGMLPIINQMSAAGLVTLPGIMTGQILAGLDPIAAVKYQILLMFLLGGGGGLAAIMAAMLTARRFTDGRERLRLDRLTAAQ